MRRVTALPAANASASSDSVDLKADEVGPVGANLEVHMTLPAVPALVDDKVITVTFEDSADDSTFAAVVGAPVLSSTGVDTPGGPGDFARFYLPPGTRRYVRATAAVQADGGNNTGVDFTLDFKV